MRKVLEPLALTVGALLVALVLGEIALRLLGAGAPIWYRPDPQLGWTLRPGAAGWFTEEGRAFVEVNAQGRRDPGFPLDKPADAYRIAVLGDSYSEAMQVSRDEAYWAVLPERLTACGFAPGKRIEVLNFGVAGYGTAQQYLRFQSQALAYQPDLVLLQFTNGNDVPDNSPRLAHNRSRPFFVPSADGGLRLDASFVHGTEFRRVTSWPRRAFRALAEHSRVLQLVRELKRLPLMQQAQALGVEQGLEAMVLAPPPDARWEEAWRVTEALIERIHHAAARHGARTLVFSVPYAIQVHPKRELREALQAKLGVPDLFYPDRRIAEFAASHGIEALPLAPGMQRLAEERGAYFHGFAASGMGRGHWNAQGHRAAAELIARRLCAARETVKKRQVVVPAKAGTHDFQKKTGSPPSRGRLQIFPSPSSVTSIDGAAHVAR
jgi:hypothetical protein